jgi:serine/threonine protein kinase
LTDDFSKIFASFLDGESSFEELQLALSRSLTADEATRSQNTALIESGFRDGRLPYQVYFALKDTIGRGKAHTAAEVMIPGNDSTRIASRSPVEDATRIRSAPPEQRADTEFPTGPSKSQTNNSVARTGPTDVRWSDLKAWPEEARNSLGIGTVLKERFVLEEELGRGGMGSVFKALDRRKEEARDRDPHVAIKILGDEFKQHPDSFVALQREARRAQSLSHPNVVNVFDFDRDGPHVFMTMEYLEGTPLDKIIRELPRRGMPYADAWPIISGIGDALAYGHKKRVVHSDFKPGNVFICEDGTPKVLDFGISRPVRLPDDLPGTMTRFDPGEVFGGLTEAYAALEMFQRQSPDPRDDIYALACVCYELLTGRHPFDKASALEAEAKKIMPRRIRRLSDRQWRGLQNGLAFRREARTASVEEFLREIGPMDSERKRLSRPRIVGIAAASAVMVALLVAVAVSVNNRIRTTSGVALPKGPPPVLTGEQQQIHAELLEEAAAIIEDAKTTADPGSLIFMLSQSPNSATRMLGTVLEENPFNDNARKLIAEVGDIYAEAAESLLDRGQISTSLQLVRYGLDADGNSTELAGIERKICRRAPAECGD